MGWQIGNLSNGMDLRRDRVQEMSLLLNQLKQVLADADGLWREGSDWEMCLCEGE